MTPKLLIRIAAGCLLFFALGHSMGHTTRKDIDDPKAQEVLKAMSDYKYDMFGQPRSFDENFTGMSLNLIFTLLAFIMILWVVSGVANENKKMTSAVLWPICICVAAFAVTGFLYFFLLPAITC